jgi:methionyl-tRNA formyltransferase
MGARLLVRTIPDYIAGKLQPRPQPTEGVSYAPKIKKQDGQVDWSQPARAIWNRVRGLAPWPGAFTHLSDQPRTHLLKIWQAEVAPDSEVPASGGLAGEVLRADKTGLVIACGVGALCLLVLQREGGRRLKAHEFLAGHALKPGLRLG